MIIFMNMPKQTNLIEPTKYDAYKVQLACVKDVSKQFTAKQAAKCHKKKKYEESQSKRRDLAPSRLQAE